MQKMVGSGREQHTQQLALSFNQHSTHSSQHSEILSQKSNSLLNTEDKEEDNDQNGRNPEINDEDTFLNIDGVNNLIEIEEEDNGTTNTSDEEEEATCSVNVINLIDQVQLDTGTPSPVPPLTSHIEECTTERFKGTVDATLVNLEDLEVKKEEVENELILGLRLKRFTCEEDNVLKEGIKKYGLGKWSVILKDKDLHFHQSRTRDSLRMRADTLGISKKSKKGRKSYKTRRK